MKGAQYGDWELLIKYAVDRPTPCSDPQWQPVVEGCQHGIDRGLISAVINGPTQD